MSIDLLMGNASSSSIVDQSHTSPSASTNKHHSACPVVGAKQESPQSDVAPGTSACPVMQPTNNQREGCPIKGNAEDISKSGTKSTEDAYKNPHMYNVYNQRLDSKNNMPSSANQQPSPGQKMPLDQQRVKSSIPKGGTDSDTWQYPSPQMFWNALVRKNKIEGASEADIEAVVAVHNNMNEKTWKQVMIWESLHSGELKRGGEEPKLLRFLGRPNDISPRAYLKSIFGHPKPFDRHDWFVDRGGKQVRYIIDYYHDESNVNADVRPTSMHDTKSVKSIIVEVRPAADSAEAIFDRMFIMPWNRFQNNPKVADYINVPFFAQSKMLQAELVKRSNIDKQWSEIVSKCEKDRLALQNCQDAQECSAATVRMQKCTASIVCPETVRTFDECIGKKEIHETDVELAYTGVLKCLEMFEIESKQMLENKK